MDKNPEDLMKYGLELLRYIQEYRNTIRERKVVPNVKPGFLASLIPDSTPQEGESLDVIIKDVERIIMPGMMHWTSPYNHAYFPAQTSVPSILGDLLTSALNCICFTWASSPVGTELEIHVMDWLAKMVDLPKHFLHSTPNASGGGTILTTGSDGNLNSMLVARRQAISRYRANNPEASENLFDSDINSKLISYCSEMAHSSVEKNAMISLVRIRSLPVDSQTGGLRGSVFLEAIQEDIQNGLIPFYLCCSLGSTGVCSFDHLNELGNICQQHEVWLHCDAAYAGSSFICPEFRDKYFNERTKFDSISFNPSKWFQTGFDCTAFYIADSTKLHDTFCVNPLYLRHGHSSKAIDFMNWQVPLSKRFRAIKLWLVLRYFGVTGMQKCIRENVRLAQYFASLVKQDDRFEIPLPNNLGLVPFRLKGPDELSDTLLRQINGEGLMHMVPAKFKETFVMRFVVTSPETTKEDIDRDWAIIQKWATVLLQRLQELVPSLVEQRTGKKDFPSTTLNTCYESSDMEDWIPGRFEASTVPGSSKKPKRAPQVEKPTPWSRTSLIMSNTMNTNKRRSLTDSSYLAVVDNDNAINSFVYQLVRLIEARKHPLSDKEDQSIIKAPRKSTNRVRIKVDVMLDFIKNMKVPSANNST